MSHGKFATAVNCMDGRTQIPIIDYIRRKYGVDYVDNVTEAGADYILDSDSLLADSIRRRVEISVKKHGSHVVAVVGHFDCAGNPVYENTHLKNIREGVKRVSSWFPGVEVVGLWVDEKWSVHEVK